MKIHDAIADARRTLERAGIDPVEAAVDADLLARTVLGWDRARLLASLNDPLPPDFQPAYVELVRRREGREPAAHIVGCREFWGLQFEVDSTVLVPRPETELIVEEALARLAPQIAASLSRFGRVSSARPEHVEGRTDILIADVGTGSGCLAVTLAREIPGSRLVATDTSGAALDVARRNAARHEVADRVDFVQTSLLADVDARFDLIVSNPPYVPAREMQALPPEVRDHEPHGALFGGEDGLDVVRALLLQAESRLEEGALLVFEFGFGQEEAVKRAIGARPAFSEVTIRRDLQGIPRTAVVRWEPVR